MEYTGKSFSELEIDESFESQLTVTESHIVLGAGLFGDFNPLHVSEQYCENTRFGKRILHGPLTSALMSAARTVLATKQNNRQQAIAATLSKLFMNCLPVVPLSSHGARFVSGA